MIRRISNVNLIYINSVSFSSIFEIGDSKKITPYSQALAEQREVPIFFSNEGDFNQYPIFKRELPSITINEQIHMNVCNQRPIIKVNALKIIGVSSSSVMHVGSTDIIDAKSKVKHIRRLLDRK